MAIKVSVVVPIYNAEKYLYQCLETLLGQTLQEIEVILIDDGSTDNSYQICQDFAGRDNRIHLYKQKIRGQERPVIGVLNWQKGNTCPF